MILADMKTKAYFLSMTDSTSLPDATFNVLANNAVERVVSLILKSDGRWQYDDTNQTDLPIGTTALVVDQQDYAIATAYLSITRVEVKDSAGNWKKLQPIDQADIYDQSLTDWLKTSGTPQYYDKIGNSLFLYPKPNYAQDASLKVWFQRAPVAITTNTASSWTPGFNSLYHDLIPLWVAYEYCIANGLDQANQIFAQIAIKEAGLADDYAVRGKDDHIRLQARRGNFR